MSVLDQLSVRDLVDLGAHRLPCPPGAEGSEGAICSASRDFEPLRSAASSARAFVIETLRAWGDDAIADDAVAVVNELFTNAVAHSHTVTGVRLRRLSGTLIVEIEDLGPRTPGPGEPAEGDGHFLGPQLVEALATRWACRPTELGKVVWAQLVTGEEVRRLRPAPGSATRSPEQLAAGVVATTQEPEALLTASPPAPPDRIAASVLVCDDKALKRYFIAGWLRRAGYTVVEAETGSEAMHLAARGSIDLAILAVDLQDMTGLGVCRAIKSDARTAGMPVLQISATLVEPESRGIGLDIGADAYLVEPIEPLEMLSTVRTLLRSSGVRQSAERLATQLGRLATASLRINVALNPARLAQVAAEGIARVLESESIALLLEDLASSAVARTSADGLTTTWQVPTDVASALIQEASDDRFVHQHEAPWSELLSGTLEGAWVITPVRRGEEVVGLIGVPAHAERSEADRMLMHRVASSVAIALDNLRVFVAEHHTALTLQRSLLPASLPTLPGLDVAARYKASSEQAEIGGDFFDAFQTDDGRSIVVIGDVQGHSLEAAIVMAELRYSLRAYIHDGYAANEALSRLNSILLRGHPEMTATVCVLVFPPDQRTVEVANAGHLPPLLLHAGSASYLEPGGTLLGIEVSTDEPVTIELSVGDRLLLMTDGLVERRTESIDATLARFAFEVRASELPAEELCDRVMERWGDGEDDVCLIVLDVLDAFVVP